MMAGMNVFGDLLGLSDEVTFIGYFLDGGAGLRNVYYDPDHQLRIAEQMTHYQRPASDWGMMLNAFAPKLTEAERTARAGMPWMDLA